MAASLYARPLAVALMLVLSPNAQAQGVFEATPDPYDARGGDPLVLTNTGTEPIVIDSVAFVRNPDYIGIAYVSIVDLSTTVGGEDYRETVSCPTVLDGGCDLPNNHQRPPVVDVIGRPIPPGGTVAVRLSASCESCRGGGDPPVQDSLEVYVEGGGEPLRVSTTFEVAVSSEDVPPAPSISISPSVTLGRIEVSITGGGPSATRVEVYDTLGRLVMSLRAGAARGRVPVDLSELTPGWYLVAVWVGPQPPVTKPVVVVR